MGETCASTAALRKDVSGRLKNHLPFPVKIKGQKVLFEMRFINQYTLPSPQNSNLRPRSLSIEICVHRGARGGFIWIPCLLHKAKGSLPYAWVPIQRLLCCPWEHRLTFSLQERATGIFFAPATRSPATYQAAKGCRGKNRGLL